MWPAVVININKLESIDGVNKEELTGLRNVITYSVESDIFSISELSFLCCCFLTGIRFLGHYSWHLNWFASLPILSFPDGPIITEDELTSLPLVKVVPDGQYTGAKLNTVVRMMRGLLEQKVPLQEFEVRIYLKFHRLWIFWQVLRFLWTSVFPPGRIFRTSSLWTTV